jgi:hypothetical protein
MRKREKQREEKRNKEKSKRKTKQQNMEKKNVHLLIVSSYYAKVNTKPHNKRNKKKNT